MRFTKPARLMSEAELKRSVGGLAAGLVKLHKKLLMVRPDDVTFNYAKWPEAVVITVKVDKEWSEQIEKSLIKWQTVSGDSSEDEIFSTMLNLVRDGWTALGTLTWCVMPDGAGGLGVEVECEPFSFPRGSWPELVKEEFLDSVSEEFLRDRISALEKWFAAGPITCAKRGTETVH